MFFLVVTANLYKLKNNKLFYTFIKTIPISSSVLTKRTGIILFFYLLDPAPDPGGLAQCTAVVSGKKIQ